MRRSARHESELADKDIRPLIGCGRGLKSVTGMGTCHGNDGCHGHAQPLNPVLPSVLPVTMADQTELAFVKNFVKTIAVQPVAFDDDYQAPPHLALKRVPILSVRSSIIRATESCLELSSRRFQFHPCQNVKKRRRRQQVSRLGHCRTRACFNRQIFQSGHHQHYVQVPEAPLRLHSRYPVH